MRGDSATPPSGSLDSEALLSPAELALIYLRVSDKKQLDTAIDLDPNGLSIATQEVQTRGKVGEIGAELAHPPFIEKGISAKTVDHRPQFKLLLDYVQKNPGIKYVVVYMRSRAFRNRFDAAMVEMQLQKFGVRLISVKEDFGEGPHAVAMAGMLDVMNDLQNTMQGLDVRDKMFQKAKAGGTVGRAPLGYLNVKKQFEGKAISTVILDPQRSALVLRAWELYATGDYSIDRLEATMADEGLTSRPSQRKPYEHPVSASKLHAMLKDPYYAGFVVYKGHIYPGRHEPLVSHDLFDRVQNVLNLRSAKGQRDRVHAHYLRGDLFCGRCHRQGRTSRLIFTKATSHTGRKYDYFKCRVRQEGLCDLPHLPAHAIEDAITEHYRTAQLPKDFIEAVTAHLDDTVKDQQASTRELHASLNRQLTRLTEQEARLVDALADDTLPADQIRAKMRNIKIQRTRIQASLTDTGAELAIGEKVLRQALQALHDPHSLYSHAANDARRLLNQTFYEHFYVDDDTETFVSDSSRTPLLQEFYEATRAHQRHRASTPGAGIAATQARQQHAPHSGDSARATSPVHDKSPDRVHAVGTPDPDITKTDSLTLADVFSVNGLNKAVMVGAEGIEPPTAGV
ncbi:recombinase family protein [Nocardia takedensis]